MGVKLLLCVKLIHSLIMLCYGCLMVSEPLLMMGDSGMMNADKFGQLGIAARAIALRHREKLTTRTLLLLKQASF